MATNLSRFLNGSVDEITPQLLGLLLRRTINGHTVMARIVEVEAYDQTDVASHSYNGRTPRTDIMFGPAGHLYVYFVYGMHYCCNVVVGPEGYGAAVLIRAVEIIEGEEYINPHNRVGVRVTNGPAKLCQILEIDKNLNGHDLTEPPLELIKSPFDTKQTIVQTKRVGLSKGKDTLWRFYIKGNRYVSNLTS